MSEKETGSIMPFGWIIERKSSILKYGSKSSYYEQLRTIMKGKKLDGFRNSNVFTCVNNNEKFLFYVCTSKAETNKKSFTANNNTFTNIVKEYDDDTIMSAFLVLIRSSKEYFLFKISKAAANELGNLNTSNNEKKYDSLFSAKYIPQEKSGYLDISVNETQLNTIPDNLDEAEKTILTKLQDAIGTLDNEGA